MRIIKSLGRRGPHDILWCVGGMVRVLSLEEAVDLAFDVRAEQMAQAPQHTLWTVFARAA